MKVDFKLLVLLAIVFFIAKEDKPRPKLQPKINPPAPPQMAAPPQMVSPPRVPSRIGDPFVPNSMAYANQGSDTQMFEALNPAPRRIGGAFLYSSPESF